MASWRKAGAGQRQPKRARGARGGAAPRETLYDEVTARIVGELEAGHFPWVQPWDAAKAGLGLPHNAASERRYSGINILILWNAAVARGHASHGWLTFRQALAAGGAVRKGETGVTVCFADRFVPQAEQARAERDGDAPDAVPFLKRFTVFNADQCEGLPESYAGAPLPRDPARLVPEADELIRATGADLRVGGSRAYYAPHEDFVAVPPASAFHAEIDWYRTALHELGHWTGHRTRLARDQGGGFGSPAYAREELVAELSAAFTCAALGIQPTVRHADYLASWLTVLRADSRAIFKAASLASKASDFLFACRIEAAA